MRVRDELVRAAVFAAFDERDATGRVTRATVETIVRVHRLAPLVEWQLELQRAGRIVDAIDLLRETGEVLARGA